MPNINITITEDVAVKVIFPAAQGPVGPAGNTGDTGDTGAPGDVTTLGTTTSGNFASFTTISGNEIEDSGYGPDDYYTETEIDTISGTLQTDIDGKADIVHIHDDRYYTESEVDTISGSLSAEIDADILTHKDDADAHHPQTHTIVSHDTTATGSELNTLTDNSIANTLHRHSELVASDGSPDPVVSVDATGDVGIGTASPGAKLDTVGSAVLAAHPIVQITNTASSAYLPTFGMLAPNMTVGQWNYMSFGKAQATNNSANIVFVWNGSGSSNNHLGFNFYGSAEKMVIKASGNVGIGTTSPDEKLEVVGNAKISGYITGKKCGVFASLDEPADTTITTAGTYYPILGTFTNDPLEDFGAATADPPGIKYTGTKTQYFEVDWHADGYGDSNGITIHIGIKKNGVLCTRGVMGTFLKFIDEEQALSGTCVLELVTNDEIQLVITSDGNGDILTMHTFTTTITEFFD